MKFFGECDLVFGGDWIFQIDRIWEWVWNSVWSWLGFVENFSNLTEYRNEREIVFVGDYFN